MAAPMPIGFNFRDTLGYVTDVSPDVFAGSSVAYSATPGYGWTATTSILMLDRGAVGGPAHLAGCAAVNNVGLAAPIVWRVDVDPTKSYKIRAALGDGQFYYPQLLVQIYDGAGVTPIHTINGVMAGGANGEYIDASGARRTSYSTWVSDNLPVTLAAAAGYFRVEVGRVGGTGYSVLSHLSLLEIPPAPVVTADPSPATRTQPATASFSATLSGTYLGLQWEVSTNSGGSWASVSGGSGATTLTYTTGATSLLMDGYLYRLAVTWEGGVVYSASALLSVNDGPPGEPSTIAASATGGTTATITWAAGSPVGASYDVEVETPSGAENWAAPAGVRTGTSFAATGLTPATEYRARIRGVNGAGNSTWTTGSAFTTDNPADGGADLGDGADPDPDPAPVVATGLARVGMTSAGVLCAAPGPVGPGKPLLLAGGEVAVVVASTLDGRLVAMRANGSLIAVI